MKNFFIHGIWAFPIQFYVADMPVQSTSTSTSAESGIEVQPIVYKIALHYLPIKMDVLFYTVRIKKKKKEIEIKITHILRDNFEKERDASRFLFQARPHLSTSHRPTRKRTREKQKPVRGQCSNFVSKRYIRSTSVIFSKS